MIQMDLEDCAVSKATSAAANSEGCDNSSTGWFDCNLENGKRYSCLVEDGSGIIDSSVTGIEESEGGEAQVSN